MRSISISPAKALANMELFKTRKVILDVGAGAGVHICQLLKSNKSLFGILYDLSNVFRITGPYLEQEGVHEQCDLVIGDMFVNDWPEFNSNNLRVDTIFLSQILHDWDLTKGLELVYKAFETLPIGGLLLIHEKLLNSNRTGPIATAMVSLDMLFWTKGQQYTKEKLFEILQKVGFKEFFSIPTTGYWSITGAYKR